MKTQIEALEKKLKEWDEEKRMKLNRINCDNIWNFNEIYEKCLEKIKLKNQVNESILNYTKNVLNNNQIQDFNNKVLKGFNKLQKLMKKE
ncbi:hypothetical protein RFI_37396 [Reticulomyxa filosa]|uniref:Uncharacterized protein n=1 Tax=Reticulomyxa filosa TaxID=46433 RepID=X6LES2_RETFI|nr:hypothetical protein RFI_37396 [Reticulomyxa filosa]|eukprot:ETO00064.1 hypothetical protein RFI_37396 [Reticulomyxa filosa]